MAINNKTVPSTSSLIIFETAAQQGSFTLAAKELCVTPTAISKQIRQLESFLNTQLFVRQKQGLELTFKGRQYLQTVTPALEILAEATQSIDDDAMPVPLNLEIGACFSHFWLIPRLDDFREGYVPINCC